MVQSFSFQYLRYLIVTSLGNHVAVGGDCGLLECALWFNISHFST